MTDSKTYIIDANNVCLRRDRDKPTQRQTFHVDDLAEVIAQVEARGAQWLSIADANFAFLEKDKGDDAAHAAWRKIQARDDFDKKFTILSGGQKADERILDWADRKGWDIISCDQYRDYLDRHPWLRTKGENGKYIEGIPLRVHQIDIIYDEVDVRWGAPASARQAHRNNIARKDIAKNNDSLPKISTPPPRPIKAKLTPEEEQEIQKLKEMIIEEQHKVLKESEAMKRSQIDCFFEAINENAPSAKTLLKIGGVALAAGAAAYGLKKMYTP